MEAAMKKKSQTNNRAHSDSAETKKIEHTAIAPKRKKSKTNEHTAIAPKRIEKSHSDRAKKRI